MPISSTSLFHYTNGGLPAIKGILETGFRVSYNKEINPQIIGHFGKGGTFGMAFSISNSGLNFPGVRYQHIPMVCFCDIRFSSISDHLKIYGFDGHNGNKKAYAIGLTKSWGQKNGLNPILYLVPGSDLVTQLAAAIQYSKQRKEISDGNRGTVEIYCPPKPMGSGYMVQDNKDNIFPATYLYSKVIEKVHVIRPGEFYTTNFQDEKEWRYIPKEAAIIDQYEWNEGSTNRRLYDSMHSNALRAIKETSYSNLTFDHSDIAHVIVSDEHEVLEVHEVLKSKFPDLDPSSMAVLLSKVNSFDNLSRDW